LADHGLPLHRLAALLVRSLGVLITGLGMIAGQLVGSLVLDVVIPSPGAVVALPTVLGTVLTLGRDHRGHPAVAQGSLCTKRRGQRPVG
jgi:transporter family-2 protein